MSMTNDTHFWDGFETRAEKLKPGNKRCVIILFWSEGNKNVVESVGRMKIRHPSVKVKFVASPEKMTAHKVTETPTILLLRNGREVDRVTGTHTLSDSILSQLFRRAYM